MINLLKLFLTNLSTFIKLGLFEIIYIAWYKLSLKSGIRKIFFPVKYFSFQAPFFLPSEKKENFHGHWHIPLIQSADLILSGQLRYYGYHWKQVGNPPDWFLNPFNGKQCVDKDLHWTSIPDFNSNLGDIKNIWEASRFEWIVTLSRAYRVSHNEKYLEAINCWLKNWTEQNPLNIGPNWKCGQEASIRVFNLINSHWIISQSSQPTTALADLIYSHLKRIHANIRYGITQNNNHGISEAAGLYIGGLFLANLNETEYHDARKIAHTGRKWLENRIKILVEPDGSFSQHSITYHRVMTDTLCFVEFWRKQLNDKLFSPDFYQRIFAAVEWLFYFTDEVSGNAPNLGHNDGSMLLNAHACDYRDFRPTIQFANHLFNNTIKYRDGPWDEMIFWFANEKIYLETDAAEKRSKIFPGGYIYLKTVSSWALLRFPYFKFRPAHNDVFHFDLWFKGKNILHDCGTYTYNPDPAEISVDLMSVRSHNTISFDEHEQMPRISRFLLGKWIKPDQIGEITYTATGNPEWQGSYTDSRGNHHLRKIITNNAQWIIQDELKGNFSMAEIGFNFLSDETNIVGDTITTSWGEITLEPNSQFQIKSMYGSDYYWEKHIIYRLIVKLDGPQKFITSIKLNI